MSSAPPGWYAQPDGTDHYWDGRAWTGAVRRSMPAPVPHAAGPGPYPSAYPQDAPASGPASPHAYAPTYAGYPAPPVGGYYRMPPKNPGLALVASFFVPGLGTMLNGEVGKGAAILVAFAVSFGLILLLIGIPLVVAVWVWGMVDAYSGAQNINRRNGYYG